MDAGIGNDFSFSRQVLATHCIGINGSLILAMCCYEARRLTEQTHQHLVLIHQHVACAASHEQLDATNLTGIRLNDFREVVVGST